MIKHSKSSQNIKFVLSLEYLKDEVEFLHADKHQLFLKVYLNTLGVKVSYQLILSLLIGMIKNSQSTQRILKVLKLTRLQYLYNISEKKLGNEFIFCI